MQECIDKVKRRIKEKPFFYQMFSSIAGNSFVQTLIFILIGIIILFFAKGENKEIINTVGVTIITASLFKFLLSANAFTNVISNVIKESFFDMTFIKDYRGSKLFSILDNVSDEILERNYQGIKKPLKMEIFNILGEQNGYYNSLTIEYEDSIKDNNLNYTNQTVTIDNFSRFSEKYKSKLTMEKIPGKDLKELYKVTSIKLNGEEIEIPKFDIKEYSQNGTNFVSFYFDFVIEEGHTNIKIKNSFFDAECEHTFFMKKTCANIKVIYKFDDTIIEPKIISKYGEEDLKHSSYSGKSLQVDYGDKPFFKNEFIFIKFKRKDYVC